MLMWSAEASSDPHDSPNSAVVRAKYAQNIYCKLDESCEIPQMDGSYQLNT